MADDSSRPELPAEFAAVERATAAALASASGAGEWGAGARRRALAWVQRQRDVLTVLEGKVVTAEAEHGTWGLTGDRDLPGFLGRVSRQGRGAGMAAAGQAATLAAMPTVADAVVDGPVTARHLQEITRATGASPSLATRLSTGEGQTTVVEMARRLDGQAFGRALRQMSAALDPATRQRQHDEQRANRYLTISHTPGGTMLKAQLDGVAGRDVAKALDALNPRSAADDDRDRPQRQADALVAMARRVLTDSRTTPDAVAPVQAVVTLSEETWAALRAARAGAAPSGGSVSGGARTGGAALEGAVAEGAAPEGRVRDGVAPDGSARDVLERLRGVLAVVDEDGQPWPASEIGRALCDCELTRVVLDAASQPLDLGRGNRLFNRNHWLALYASGQQTCAVDGCDMPLRYTELHHMRWWRQHGGRTDRANLAPECSFHHHEIHRLAISVTRRDDGTYEHRYPDGRLYGGPPPAAVSGAPCGAAPPVPPALVASVPSPVPPAVLSTVARAMSSGEPSAVPSPVPSSGSSGESPTASSAEPQAVLFGAPPSADVSAAPPGRTKRRSA